MNRLFFCLAIVLTLPAIVSAQEFEIKKFDLTTRVVPEEYKIDVQAHLRLVNLSGPDLADRILLSTSEKPRLSFFLNLKAKVQGMKVNGETVTHKTAEDPRNALLRVSTDINTTIAKAREFEVEFEYSIPSADRNASLHVSNSETFLLPASFWVPVVHTPYADHGTDTAPMSITVTAPQGLKVVSSGIRKSDNAFEQSMAAQPFFFAGDYDVLTRGGESYPVEVYLPRGTSENGKQQAQRLAIEAERVMAFYVKYFGVSAIAPFRIIATQARQLSTATTDAFSQNRDISFATVGAVAIDDNFFRRDTMDLGTIELLAGAAARAWIDGQVLLRGRGTGMLRDGLPVYLAAQYLGTRFGREQQDESFDRARRAYASIARSDAPLLMQSQLDRNYTTSVFSKGALIWRLLEQQIGRQNFDNALRGSLSRTKVDVLSLGEWRSPLCAFSRCANLKSSFIATGANRKLVEEIFTNWIDTVVLPDFAVGQPQKTANGIESTVANFGTGDLTMDVLALTDKGEKLRQTVTVKASEYGTVSFPAGTNIAVIEADPDKLYLQNDYLNDRYPRLPSESEAYGKANIAFSKNDFPTAEAMAREAMKVNPEAPTLRTLLGRALLGQNKQNEAATIFEAVLKTEPLPIQAYGWAHLGLGEIALQRNQGAEAVKHYLLAAAADLDAATTIAARDGALKAERAANAAKVPDELRTFLQKFDAAVLQSNSAVVNPFIDLGNLRKFAQSLVVRKPSIWVTETLRSEDWDSNRTAVDVTLKIKIEGKDYTGRAVYVINRGGGRMLLSEVPVFDVK
ncbi:MAG TPA: tetratricopeptide repeat protein [Blastocatellia bacterium]|nr:tetratricopeptide repeat protein [Blastocatellia bacterium]